MDFGIDFGTTNSACVGIIQKRRAVKFSDDFGFPFPSLIMIDQTSGKVYSGRKAWRNREEYSQSCEVIPSIKSHLGTDKTWTIAGRVWTPEMVAAEILLGLKEQVVKKRGGDNIIEAVIAIPVGFSPQKRVALRKAAILAGIKIKSFVSEPTAALFCHYEQVGHHSKIAVFDWGGGTLDIAIVENRHGKIKELATGGLSLGGDDIDMKLALWAHNEIIVKKGAKVSFDQMLPSDRDKLIASCEQAKRELSIDDRTEIRIWKYGELGEVSVSVDIDTFVKLIQYDVQKAIGCFDDCLKQARIGLEEVECILMVGGSVNLRPFSEKVSKLWRGKPIYPSDSDWSVAMGAANLSLQPGQYVSAQTIGVTMSDGSPYPLINEGETISFGDEFQTTFAVVEDTPTANFIFSDLNGKSLGYLNVPSFGFFKEKIDLNCHVDSDLIFNVDAKSQRRSDSSSRTWAYTGLRLNYQLPVELKVTGDD